MSVNEERREPSEPKERKADREIAVLTQRFDDFMEAYLSDRSDAKEWRLSNDARVELLNARLTTKLSDVEKFVNQMRLGSRIVVAVITAIGMIGGFFIFLWNFRHNIVAFLKANP